MRYSNRGAPASTRPNDATPSDSFGLGVSQGFGGVVVRKASQIAAESDREQRLYDTLGPKAREVIRNSPHSVDLKLWYAIQQFKLGRDDCDSSGFFIPWDPQSPEGDTKFSEYVKGIISKQLSRPYERAMLPGQLGPPKRVRERCLISRRRSMR